MNARPHNNDDRGDARGRRDRDRKDDRRDDRGQRGRDQRGGDQRGGDRPYRPRRDDDRGGYRPGGPRGGGGQGGGSYGDRPRRYDDRPRSDDRGGSDRGGSDRGYRGRDDRGGYRGGSDRGRSDQARGGGRDSGYRGNRDSGYRGDRDSGYRGDREGRRWEDRPQGDRGRPAGDRRPDDRDRRGSDDRSGYRRDDRGDRSYGDRGRGGYGSGRDGGRDNGRGGGHGRPEQGGYRRPEGGRSGFDRDRGSDRDRGERRFEDRGRPRYDDRKERGSGGDRGQRSSGGRWERRPDDRRDRPSRPDRPARSAGPARPESARGGFSEPDDRGSAGAETPAAPALPDDVDAAELDKEVRAELQSLARQVGDTVARHLVAAGRLLDDDPAAAYAHTLAARRSASRVAAVREAVGLAAYRAGEWQAAITELRTYHRLSGRRSHLALLADSERALGRPERAVDLYRTTPREDLTPDEAVELLIVAAGARQDLGQAEAAVSMLQVRELAAESGTAFAPRLRYAYADALVAVGRREEAREWFARAAAADEDSTTDAAERLLELDGVTLTPAVLDEEAAVVPPAVEQPPAVEPAADLAPDEAALVEAEPDQTALVEAEPDEAEPDAGEPVVGAPVSADVPEPAETETETVEPETPETVPAAAAPLVSGYDLVVLDLDGVVYLGDEAVPGAVPALARLRQEGIAVAYATNNASRSAADVAAALRKLGVEAADDEVVTSAMAAAEALRDRFDADTAVLVVGSDALVAEVSRVGLRPVERADERPAAVVQGYGPEVGWRELAEASVAIRAGAFWVATNTDRTLPTPRGPLPGNGSLVAVLRTALDREPDLVVGKPGPAVFAAAAQRHAADRVLVVGDRLDTDIAGARAAGMDSLLVLTGVDTADRARRAATGDRPTYLGDDLAALFGAPRRL